MTNDNMGVLRQLAIAVLADRLYILGSDQWAAPELVARWNAEITPTTILELTRELAAARAANQECDLLLSRVLHELAGASSLCWEPKPTGVFDTEQATAFVEEAINELRVTLRREK